MFFVCKTNEVELSAIAKKIDLEYKQARGDKISSETTNTEKNEKVSKDWIAWMKEGNFWIHGLVYMLVRISVNATMTVQPFYL